MRDLNHIQYSDCTGFVWVTDFTQIYYVTNILINPKKMLLLIGVIILLLLILIGGWYFLIFSPGVEAEAAARVVLGIIELGDRRTDHL